MLALVLFTTIFTFSSFRDSGEQLIVVVDAAHGGEAGRYIEKDVSLNISKILASYSGKKVKIIETRNTDKFISLNDRVKFINSVNPDLVVSLHSNAYLKDTLVNGVEAYYYDHNEFNEKSRNYSQILLENQLDKFSNRGVKRAGFFMIKNINCPDIVLELGFMTNERDRAILTSKRHQK
ncbi:N-acetylmuramoyl-L-alanine amidase family protein [Corallibacter sp.]|uniref:N-acetylmuramoyl-L-alanine amidase family protein n=1 Tax=Corallibacter sp. TaxID=2038084 RepID=UPI003AB4FA34